MLTKEQSSYLRKRTWAEVNLDNLAHNVGLIKELLNDGAMLMSVVKADGYGHGMINMARELSSLGTDWFGVNELEEAIALRKSGISEPILVFTPPLLEYVYIYKEYNLTMTLSNYDYAIELDRLLIQKGIKINAHLKIDTGMSRQGIKITTRNLDETLEIIEKISKLKSFNFTGIYTHFASADCIKEELQEYRKMQFQLFSQVLNGIEEKGMNFGIRHCANSAATLCDKEYHLDMVRAGIIIYGASPGERCQNFKLKPVMEIFSRLTEVKEVDAGQGVSYGCEYVTINTVIVGVVAIGYADGYPRGLGGRAAMQYKDTRVRNIGRVCMDQQMLDLTGTNAKIGEVIKVVGGEVSWDLLAALFRTINYELMCFISNRVPRIYIKSSEDVDYLFYGNK